LDSSYIIYFNIFNYYFYFKYFVFIIINIYLAIAVARPLTIPALILKRSSRVIPGLRGTPAGTTTISQPIRALSSSLTPLKPVTLALVLMWLKSVATPGALTISYKASSSTSGCFLRIREMDWPIPPAALYYNIIYIIKYKFYICYL